MLQDVIEEVQQQAAAEGALGRGNSRYLDLARPDAPLPPGAAWAPVKVKSVSQVSCALLWRKHPADCIQQWLCSVHGITDVHSAACLHVPSLSHKESSHGLELLDLHEP